MLLVRVAAHSPAAIAGLQVGDRIDEINHQRFTGCDAFDKLIRSLSGKTTLLVEREGQMKTISITIPKPSNRAAPPAIKAIIQPHGNKKSAAGR
jgi:C-terminal processing protease CtpA/Prc